MSFLIIVLNLFQSGKFSNICSKYESFRTSAEFLIVFRKTCVLTKSSSLPEEVIKLRSADSIFENAIIRVRLLLVWNISFLVIDCTNSIQVSFQFNCCITLAFLCLNNIIKICNVNTTAIITKNCYCHFYITTKFKIITMIYLIYFMYPGKKRLAPLKYLRIHLD